MMNSAAIARYRNVQVTTSSPGEILVMLYAGLLRFLGEGAQAMRAGDRARAGERISRAHAILDELTATLNPDHAPELADNLLALYGWSIRRIIEANCQQKADYLDEVARVLGPIEEAFRAAVRGQR
jgi:flagellar protein FliS